MRSGYPSRKTRVKLKGWSRHLIPGFCAAISNLTVLRKVRQGTLPGGGREIRRTNILTWQTFAGKRGTGPLQLFFGLIWFDLVGFGLIQSGEKVLTRRRRDAKTQRSGEGVGWAALDLHPLARDLFGPLAARKRLCHRSVARVWAKRCAGTILRLQNVGREPGDFAEAQFHKRCVILCCTRAHCAAFGGKAHPSRKDKGGQRKS
jgi:hypothetical protein